MIQIVINIAIAISYVWMMVFTYNFLDDDGLIPTKFLFSMIWPIVWFFIILLYLIVWCVLLFQKCNLIKTLSKPIIWYFNSAKYLATKLRKITHDL